jgi:dTMP kinase
MSRGRLITIEGIDGAGKSTLAAALLPILEGRGIDVAVLREPGGVPASERIRDLVKDPGARIGSRAEALLYAAARAQLVEEAIEPMLARGTWVLLDRFVDSSLAYQGAGRALGIDAVRQVNQFAIGALRPDRTLLLAIDPSAGRSRLRGRDDSADRLERESDEFFSRIAEGYAELASSEPERIRVLDGMRPPEQVLAAAVAELEDLL